jgi:hypothetical protein
MGGSLAFRCVDTPSRVQQWRWRRHFVVLGTNKPKWRGHTCEKLPCPGRCLRNQSNNLQTASQGIFLSLLLASASAAETVGCAADQSCGVYIYRASMRYLPVPLSLKCYSHHWPRERERYFDAKFLRLLRQDD